MPKYRLPPPQHGVFVDRDTLNQFHADALNQQGQLALEDVNAKNAELARLQAQNPGPIAPPQAASQTVTPAQPAVPADQGDRAQLATAPPPAPPSSDTTGPSAPAPTTFPTLDVALSAAGISSPTFSSSSSAPAELETLPSGPPASSPDSQEPAAGATGGLSFASLADALNAAGITGAVNAVGQARDTALGGLGQAKDAAAQAVGSAANNVTGAVFPTLDAALSAAGINASLAAPSASPSAPPSPVADAGDRVAAAAATPMPTGALVDYARQAALNAGVDPDVFVRQINQESHFDPNALSPAGARGIGQDMPATAAGLAERLGVPIDQYWADPKLQLDGNAMLMADYLKRYNGDYPKALAAFNAGPGNVDKYGGVPPFEETQRYVADILNGAGSSISQAAQGLADRAKQWAGGLVPNQFGDPSLTSEEAYAACGPAAAVAFARANGRNPTLREAVDLAQQVGWTSSGSMNGIANEEALLDRMGIDATVDRAPNWDHIAADASSGNPVIISTPAHYFVADGVRQGTNGQTEYHVGASGTAFKQGAEWLTADRIQQLGGGVNGALFADSPMSPVPSVAQNDRQASQSVSSALQELSGQTASASTQTQPMPDWDRLGQGIADTFRNVFGGARQGAQNAGDTLGSSLPDLTGTLAQQGQSQGPLGAIASGQNLSAPEQLAAVPAVYGGASQVSEQAAEGLNPVRDVPVLGGVVNATLNPLAGGPLGTLVPVADAASLGSKLAGPALEAGASALGDLAQKTAPVAQDLLTSRQPAQLNLGLIANGIRLPSWITAPAQGAPVGFGDYVNLYRMGNLISSPATVAKVAFSSLVAPAWTLARDTATAGRLNPETIAPEWMGAFGALGDAGGAFLDALTQGSQNALSGVPTAISARAAPGLPRVLARVWELPGNVHGALQAWSSTIVGQAELGRLAAIEGQQQGLHGPQLLSFVQNVLADPDAAVQAGQIGQNTLTAAVQAGRRAALQGDLGTLGDALLQFRNATGPVGDVVAPIMKIPLNFLTQNIEKSPLGLIGTGFDVARAAAGQGPYAGAAGFAGNGIVGPLSERLANNLLGTAVTAFLVSKAADGTITGGGPSDPKLAAQLRAQGWQPDSLNLPGIGYVSADKLPPGLSEAVRIAGNIGDIQKYGGGASAAENAGALAQRLAAQLATAPGLDQAGQIYDLLKGGQGAQAFAHYLGTQASSLVPMSAAVRYATNALEGPAPRIDKNAPFTSQLQAEVQSGLPIGRDQMPATATPYPTAAIAPSDPVQQAYRAVGLDISTQPRTVQIPGSRQSIGLNPTEASQVAGLERDALRQMGVDDRVADPSFASMPAQQQVTELRRYLTAAQQQAAGEFVAGLSSDEIARRLQQRANATPTPYAPMTPFARAAARYGTPTAVANPPQTSVGDIVYPNGPHTKNMSCALTAGGPDSACTPGSFHESANINNRAARAVSQATKDEVYAAYGIPTHQRGDYEIDHLIPLALGGSNDRSNLWPQPATDPSGAGYHEKDITEVYLYEQVKAGKVPLQQAQSDVVSRWRDIYASLPVSERTRIAQSLSRMSQSERDAITN